jgi:hypothetical protein
VNEILAFLLTTAGCDDNVIRSELEQADIVLCLVSDGYLSSEYIRSVEWPIIKELYEKGEIEGAPVILHPIDLKHGHKLLHELNALALAARGKSLREYESGDYGSVYADIN